MPREGPENGEPVSFRKMSSRDAQIRSESQRAEQELRPLGLKAHDRNINFGSWQECENSSSMFGLVLVIVFDL